MLSAKEVMEQVQDTKRLSENNQVSFTEAKEIGDSLGIHWDKFGVEQFRADLNIMLEHGKRNPVTDVTVEKPMVTDKIALVTPGAFPNGIREQLL